MLELQSSGLSHLPTMSTRIARLELTHRTSRLLTSQQEVTLPIRFISANETARTRTQTKGFGDHYATITSRPPLAQGLEPQHRLPDYQRFSRPPPYQLGLNEHIKWAEMDSNHRCFCVTHLQCAALATRHTRPYPIVKPQKCFIHS